MKFLVAKTRFHALIFLPWLLEMSFLWFVTKLLLMYSSHNPLKLLAHMYEHCNCICTLMQSGGPSYRVELGRLDGLVSTTSSVYGKIPKPNFNLNQLTSFFSALGLNRMDMIALSGRFPANSNPFLDRKIANLIRCLFSQLATRWGFLTVINLQIAFTISAVTER